MAAFQKIASLSLAVLALALVANAFYIDEAGSMPLMRQKRQSSFSSLLSSLGGLPGVISSVQTPEGRQRIGQVLVNYVRTKEDKFATKVGELASQGRLGGIIRTLETTLGLPDGSANSDLQRLTAVTEALLPVGEDRTYMNGLFARVLSGGATQQAPAGPSSGSQGGRGSGLLGRITQRLQQPGGLMGALDQLSGMVSDHLSQPGALDRLAARMQALSQTGRLERIVNRVEQFLQVPSTPGAMLGDRVSNIASLILGPGALGQQVTGAVQAIFSRLNPGQGAFSG